MVTIPIVNPVNPKGFLVGSMPLLPIELYQINGRYWIVTFVWSYSLGEFALNCGNLVLVSLRQ